MREMWSQRKQRKLSPETLPPQKRGERSGEKEGEEVWKIRAVRCRRRISWERRWERNRNSAIERGREEGGSVGEAIMAQQESRGEEEEVKLSSKEEEEETAEAIAGFKFNVHAPEFVPRSQLQAAPALSAGCFCPYLQFFGNGGGGGAALGPEWFYFTEQEPVHFVPDFHGKIAGQSKSNSDMIQKIVKQVEYQFSDTNLVANDFLMKIMNKDPEGYGKHNDAPFAVPIMDLKIPVQMPCFLSPVPMSVVASWKKIKCLGANNHTLAKALRTSTKLVSASSILHVRSTTCHRKKPFVIITHVLQVLSEDGKKIKRKQVFTERDKEELQVSS
ncbi:hypothetical protein GW17_00022834 [Ensete ventricosum]|nr:hypothetical protein GW17_00022834 [Ensete ventricosum]